MVPPAVSRGVHDSQAERTTEHTGAVTAERVRMEQETTALTLRVQSDTLRLQQVQAQLQKLLYRPGGPVWLGACLRARCVIAGPLFLIAASWDTA